jgi:hypothetical protein
LQQVVCFCVSPFEGGKHGGLDLAGELDELLRSFDEDLIAERRRLQRNSARQDE